MNRVQFEASQIMISDTQPNDIYMSVLMRMFSTRANRNGYAVSEAFMDNIVANAAKYVCLPQCADAKRLRHGESDNLTHMLEEGEFQSEQIGSFFSFAKATDEFGVSLIGEARIPKRNALLCETIRKMYEAGTLTFSFEIMVSEMAECEGVHVIDAAEGNELIGMAVVSIPAYPEATALKLVAEEKTGEEEKEMEETLKKLAEAEARLKLAEQKNEETEEALKKKTEETEETAARQRESEKEQEEVKAQLAERDARIAELEAKVAELEPFKAEAETMRAEAEALKAEKAAAELAEKQKELTAFAQAQGLDVKADAVAAAIAGLDYAALIVEANKAVQNREVKPVVAGYAMTNGIGTKGEYGDLLDKA